MRAGAFFAAFGIAKRHSNIRLQQVMDTPGLLPRADEDRNEMELLTLASMQHSECQDSGV